MQAPATLLCAKCGEAADGWKCAICGSVAREHDPGHLHVGLLARSAPQGAVPVRAGVQMMLVVFAGDRSADGALPAVREAAALRAEQCRLHRHHALRADSTPRNAHSAPTAKINVAR